MQAYLAKKSMLFLAITTAILLIVGFVFYCVPLFFLALTPCHFHCKDIRFLSGLVNKVLELRTVCCVWSSAILIILTEVRCSFSYVKGHFYFRKYCGIGACRILQTLVPNQCQWNFLSTWKKSVVIKFEDITRIDNYTIFLKKVPIQSCKQSSYLVKLQVLKIPPTNVSIQNLIDSCQSKGFIKSTHPS